MPPSLPTPIVSPEWLIQHLDHSSIVVIDASWHMPDTGRKGADDFAVRHIPGAQFFDTDAISDTSSPYPHMLPAPADFAAAIGALGIGNDSLVIVYDDSAVRSAARLWWSLRAMGHDAVAVLSGGLAGWIAAGGTVTDMPSQITPRTFVPDFQPDLVRSRTDVLAAIGNTQILDARAAARFEGSAPEPRPGLRSGHIPGARNLPFGQLFNSDGHLKPAEQLEAAYGAAGIDTSAPVITSCGSGITASVLALGLATLGRHDTAVYDGSWTEWGSDPDLPLETGAASTK